MEHEFKAAICIIEKKLPYIPEGDNFFKLLLRRHVPVSWCQEKNWPPEYKSGLLMDSFSFEFHWDHFRPSGCPIILQIRREYGKIPRVKSTAYRFQKVGTVWHVITC